MTTLESIRKRKALLGKSKEEYDAFREKWENVYYELGKKLQPDAKSFDDYGYWRLIEAVGKKNPKEFIKKEYGIEMSEEDMAQLNEMLNAIRNEYPARYFETKFERPLQLSDFTAAVVPNDIPLDVESRLKDAGVEVIEYEKGDNTSRAEAMQKASAMENVRFSLQSEVASILEDYDTDGVEYSSVQDIADGIEALIAESTEDTTELENILNDFRYAQEDARNWGNRMDSGGEEDFEEALRMYVNKATLEERSGADSHNSSFEGLPLESSERLSGNPLASPKDVAKIGKNTEVTHRAAKNIINEGGLKKTIETPAQAVSALGKGLHMDKSDSSQSYYGDFFEGDYIVNGKVVHIRISTHPATPTRMGNADAGHKVSIVVRKNGEHKSDGTPHNGYTEYIYEPSDIAPIDAANAIVKGVKTLLETGEYVDETGKSVRKDYPYIENGKTLYSLITPEMDADYLSAVERGDMATAQQMVMEAAKLAMPNTKIVDENGNPLIVKHSTNAQFTVFDRAKQNYGAVGTGFYFGNKRSVLSRENTVEVLLDVKKPLVIDDMQREEMFEDNETTQQSIIEKGYDGVVVNYADKHLEDFEIVVFAPNQIKSADPVTYDDNGNVIPLSERFNPEKEDIRYSIMDADGNMIGDGSIHRPYNIVDFSNYPQIAHSVSKSISTESVYVTYRNEETGDKAVVRFSGHNNNATRFGDQMVGWDNDSPYAKRLENELKYRLGLMDKTLKYGTHIGTRSVSNADLESGKYEEADITLAELYALPAGTDISQHTGKLAKGSRELILGDVVKENRNKVVAIEYTPRFSLSEADVTLMGHAEYVKGLCELARGVYSITSPIVVAATKEDYAKTIEEAGYSSEDSETSFAVYLKNTDTIAVNAENIKEKPIFVESITHENAHSITKNLLWEDVETIASSLDEEEIDALQKIALKGYDGYSPAEILDELISTFIQYFSTKQSGNLRLLDGYLKGYFNVDDLVNYMESVAINTYGERFAPIIKALMPVLKKNLEIHKGKYERQEIGNGSATIRFDRDREAKKGNQRGVGEISGDIEGATTDTVYDSEAKTEEVDAHYSIQVPEGAEEAYKAALLEEAMRMEREATSGGVALAQEIADTTGWVHLANGVIVFDGLCNKMKLSNSATLLLYLLPKCLFTLSKLRYFKLRRPKISSCYKLLKEKEGAHKLVDTLLYLLEVVVYTTKHQDWIFMYSLRKTL